MGERVTAIAILEEEESELILSNEDLLVEIVCSVLAGRSEPSKIAAALKLPNEAKRIQSLMRSAECQKALWKAKRDIPVTMTERIKRRLPVFVEQMEGLALDSSDSRTQFAALKDLMDRGGIGATQKVALTSPEAYKRAIADLMEDEGPVKPEITD
jgi:hypothetical protein